MGLKMTSGKIKSIVEFYCSLPGSSHPPCAYVRDTDNLEYYLKTISF